MDANAILKKAKEVISIEIEGLEALKNNLNEDFVKLAQACCETLDKGGKIVITGIGKSGHVGSKIAATMASTGSPTIFMHSVEAMHGDLGMIQKDDLLIAISYSGESDEIVRVIVPAKRLGVLGDALAMVLLALRKFTKENFGRLHPAGAIGRAVTMRVGDAMRSGDRLATVTADYNVKDTLLKMTACRSGSAIIVDDAGRPAGIFTDGDFRRWAEKDLSVLERTMREVMTPGPVAVRADQMAVEVLRVLESRHIDDIVVTDNENRVRGFIDVQDLPGLKLM